MRTDDFYKHHLYNDSQPITEDNRLKKFIRLVANLSDADLLAWVSSKALADEGMKNVRNKNPLQIFDEYETLAKTFRGQCREILGQEKLKDNSQ